MEFMLIAWVDVGLLEKRRSAMTVTSGHSTENVRDEDDKNFDLIHCWHHLHAMMRIWLLFIHLQDNFGQHSWPSRYLLTFMVRWKRLMARNRLTMLHCWLGWPANMQNVFEDGSRCETFFARHTRKVHWSVCCVTLREQLWMRDFFSSTSGCATINSNSLRTDSPLIRYFTRDLETKSPPKP